MNDINLKTVSFQKRKYRLAFSNTRCCESMDSGSIRKMVKPTT